MTINHTNAVSIKEAETLLKSVAHVVRIQIVCHIHEHGSRCVHELVDELELRQPIVSQHLRVLRLAGVVIGERAGHEVRYRIIDEHSWHIVDDAVKHSDELQRKERNDR